MENILLPSRIQYEDASRPHEGTLIVEPCFHGYGTTLGNALRRVLLSSLTGAAVTAVKMKGVNHEFQAVKGVKEDALEVILNLKQTPWLDKEAGYRIWQYLIKAAFIIARRAGYEEVGSYVHSKSGERARQWRLTQIPKWELEIRKTNEPSKLLDLIKSFRSFLTI